MSYGQDLGRARKAHERVTMVDISDLIKEIAEASVECGKAHVAMTAAIDRYHVCQNVLANAQKRKEEWLLSQISEAMRHVT